MSGFTFPADVTIDDNVFDDLLKDLEYEDFGDFGNFSTDLGPLPEKSFQQEALQLDQNLFDLVAKEQLQQQQQLPVPIGVPQTVSMDDFSNGSFFSSPAGHSQQGSIGAPLTLSPSTEQIIDNFAYYDGFGISGNGTKQPSNGSINSSSSHKRKSEDLLDSQSTSSKKDTAHNSLSTAKHSVVARTNHPMTVFPISFFKAFNGGDLTKVGDLIQQNCIKQVRLKTPALDNDVIGQEQIVNLFTFIYDSHPDAVWVAKKCKYIGPQEDDFGLFQVPTVRCKIYFAGTRVLTSFGANTTHTDHSYLFKRPHSSLLDEMDISLLGEPEIAAMRLLEQKGRNLNVFGKGTLRLELTQDNKIGRMVLDWIVTSFREAEL
eukprot:gene8882-9797_t